MGFNHVERCIIGVQHTLSVNSEIAALLILLCGVPKLHSLQACLVIIIHTYAYTVDREIFVVKKIS